MPGRGFRRGETFPRRHCGGCQFVLGTEGRGQLLLSQPGPVFPKLSKPLSELEGGGRRRVHLQVTSPGSAVGDGAETRRRPPAVSKPFTHSSPPRPTEASSSANLLR